MSKQKIILICVVGLILGSAIVYFFTAPRTLSEKQRYSYAIGVDFGRNLKNQFLDIDTKAFSHAVDDVLMDKKLRMSEEEVRKVILDLESIRKQNILSVAEKNRQAGKAFREKYIAKNKTGVTAHGVLWRTLKAGHGGKPHASSTIKAKYIGRTIDDKIVDTSEGRAVEMPLRSLIPGWQEALHEMPLGAKWEVVVPSEMGYGDAYHPKIPPGSTLIYEIELDEIVN